MLQKEFLEDSYKQGIWLNEEKYEWTSNTLDTGTPSLPLLDAPKKWRLALQNTRLGVFRDWYAIVHVQESKMKKAYERSVNSEG